MKRFQRVIEKIWGMLRHFGCFILMAWKNRKKSIYIFDLDNTLGDTYPTLIHRNPNELQRLAQIKAFPRMCSLANRVAQSPSRVVFVLTARQYSTQKITEQWIANAGIDIPASHIFIVLSPMQKIILLKWIAWFCPRITFIDDMSYNLEKGEVKFYDKAIASLPLRVRYIGYKTIVRFNRSFFSKSA
jgi:hypothetical protein